MKTIIQKTGLLVTLLLTVLPMSAYDFELNGIYYNITSMSELEVEVTYESLKKSERYVVSLDNVRYYTYTNTSYSGNIVIPYSVNYNNRTFTVVAIGECAFGGKILDYNYYKECPRTTISNGVGCGITSISLPNTIRIIKNNAFRGCVNLNSVQIGNSVIEIKDYAFLNTPNLQSLELPNSLSRLGSYSLSLTGLKDLTIPNSVIELSDYACYNNSKLASLIIGNSVCSIGSSTFSSNPKLLEVFCLPKEKPDGITNAFSECHANLEIYVPSSEIYGFGREYLTFSNSSYDYTGQPHNIVWSNNLKAYKCEISESECKTDVNAGQYTKYLKATYSNGVDISVEMPYTYTINKAPITLSVNNAQREYGEANPTFTYNISGFINGENEHTLGISPTFECEASQLSKVGDYKILASLNTPNYEVTYNYGTLSIIKAPLTAYINDTSKIYGNDNPDFSLSFSGLKNGEKMPEWSIKPIFSTLATASSDVGQYAIMASNGTTINYDITKYNPGTLTITKRNLTAKANDCERLYNEENLPFEISYIGFVNGDTETSLIKKPTAECAATKYSNAGTYSIVLTGGEAENYNFVYQDGLLTVKPLTVGFKDVYNSVTYNDMNLSTSVNYFNYIPEITGPFNSDDFWIELWFLDKENRYKQHVATISGGDYAGYYVNTNVDRTMYAGKYIFNLISKGTNPNVTANPARAYLTVNRASNNLEWNADSPISVKVGEKIDLGISYQADLWCSVKTDYDKELIAISSEGETGNNPHWYVTGLKEGETTLYFNIECMKNDMGFYDFTNSQILSKRINVEQSSSGIECVIDDYNPTSIIIKDGAIRILNKDAKTIVRVYSIQGTLITETTSETINDLSSGLYIVTVGTKSQKVKI